MSPVARSRPWTTAADVATAVRRRWDDGSLLRAYAADEPFPTVDLPVRRPAASLIGDDLEAVRRWAAALQAGGDGRGGSRYDVVRTPVGGRAIGRNLLPGRVRVTEYDQAWELLGVREEVVAYRAVLDLVAEVPAVRDWVVAHPLRALAVGGEWAGVLAAYRWLVGARGSGRHLREIDAPGADTKVVERHRGLLATLLGVPGATVPFTRALGLATRPETLRLRFAPGTLATMPALSEAVLRVDELARSTVDVRRAVIVENEVTFLSLPLPTDGIVVWGKGFEVDRIGAMPWLHAAAVDYWGDLDTHGFAILHRLRAWLPRTRSFLMDRETLLAHSERWGREPSPTAALLDRLDPAESAIYADLVSDRFGAAVRLEQERIDWGWVGARLPYHPRPA